MQVVGDRLAAANAGIEAVAGIQGPRHRAAETVAGDRALARAEVGAVAVIGRDQRIRRCIGGEL